MNDTSHEKLIALVDDLNTELYEQHGEEVRLFTYVTTGYYQLIQFQSENLWNSENDSREYVEDTDEYETMDEFLRREFNKLTTSIGALKVNETAKV